LRGKKIGSDHTSFEEKQYTDIWTNDEYLQFMYERLILCRELLADNGSMYLHCDFHKDHLIRCVLDEVFGSENFQREIVWSIETASGFKSQTANWVRGHDMVLFYSKTMNRVFNKQFTQLDERTIRRYDKKDADGRRYKLYFKPDGTERRVYLENNPGRAISDTWTDIIGFQTVNNTGEYLDYPTQKPEALLERIIKASSNPGDLVFDCFMGSGTTQAVAMKLGRRFIGADINLGAIQTTTKRLMGVASAIEREPADPALPKWTGFSVYNVNQYDVFRNPVEAKELLVQALELQPIQGGSPWDGEQDEWFYKIMPVNRLATKADLEEIAAAFDFKAAEKRALENPGSPVLRLKLVCMGHEPDLKAELEKKLQPFDVAIDVVDILRDKSKLEFKRDSEAKIVRRGRTLSIEDFYPMNLLKKLSLQKTAVKEWRELAESVMVDFNYDGAVFTPSLVDVPEGDGFVKGEYEIPEGAGTIRVKMTDLLGETLETEVP